ncbi:MAG: TRAP transporter substrate-binding protein [Synergistales bacterium]|nr:TRAP transporter substrate-binding protein [Synergistales bacterium]
MKRFFALCAVSLLVVGLLAGSAFAATRWNVNSVWPTNNHHTQGLEQYASMVEEATDGELELVVQAGGALGFKGPELLKVVRDGIVPMSDMLVSGVQGDERIFGIVTLPFLVHSFEEGRLLNEIARPYFDKACEEKWNQKILYIAPWPAAGLWTKEKVTSLEDMEGLKTRTYDKNGALVMEAVGATPHPLPFSEVYSSLATGLIDSVLTSTPTAVDAKFWEVLKYFDRINVTMATDMVTVNLRAFNNLDPELQEVLVEKGKEMEEIMWSKVAELDKEKEAICNEHGIVSVPISEEFMNNLTDVTADIRDEWLAKSPEEAKEIYNAFLEEVGRK